MGSLEIGLRALLAQQRRMDVIGHNVANAATEGYSRQRANAAPTLPEVSKVGGGYVGTGVQIQSITRSGDVLLDGRIRDRSSVLGAAERRDRAFRQLEQVLAADGTGEIPARLSDLFASFREAAARPSDPALQTELLSQANLFASTVRKQGEALVDLREANVEQARGLVAEANDLLSSIASLNEQIGSASLDGSSPNDLLDQRDRLLGRLAEIVDVDVSYDRLNMVNVRAGGELLVSHTRARTIALERPDSNALSFTVQFEGEPAAELTLQSGELAGVQTAVGQDIKAAIDGLDQLADAMRLAFNAVHATGLPASGPYAELRASESVAEPGKPLTEAGLSPPIEAGEIAITVTDQASSAMETTRIAIDPTVDSLEDIAARLDAVDGIRALVDGSGALEIVAQSGYRFDFAGRPAPPPGAPSSPVPLEVEGRYAGESDTTLSFVVRGSGEVGVASPLSLEVQNENGDVVGVHEIGLGYVPGTPIEVADGVRVAIGAGTFPSDGAVVGSLELVADPDSASVLAALGVGGMFSGQGAASLEVDQRLMDDPAALALGRSGAAGDGANAERLAAIEKQALGSLDGATASEHFSRIVAGAATEARRTSEVLEAQQNVMQALEAERDAVAGVNVDEEMVKLVEVQRAYEAAARYVTVVNDILTTIMNIVR